MQMRPSRVLAKLRSGGVASSIKLNLADPRAAEIAALSGVDCVWIDREHVPNDLGALENQVRAVKGHGVDTIVRVPRGSYSDLVWPLEMDATGIMVPHLMSAAEARQVVRQTRFHPLGRRPLDGGNADGAYCMIPLDEYVRDANRERLVIVQIEDPEPMAELDAIAQVPGIDMLFFGPGDFSQGIGHTGEMGRAEIVEARRQIAQTAARYGKFAGTVASLDTLADTIALGYQFINIGADVLGLVDYFRRATATFNELTETRSPLRAPTEGWSGEG
jgi:4-hydroxy-2-oxoheptanedioate aldolase